MPLFPTQGNQVSPLNSDSLLQLGVGLLSGRNAQEQVAGAAQGFMGARKQNQTLQFLRQQSPDLAAAVESGALTGNDAFKLFYQQKLEAQKPKNNFMSVGGSLYDTSSGQWISPPADAGGKSEYGLNPIWTKDAQGNPVLFQPGKDGSINQMKFPEGYTPTPSVTGVDLGTEIQGRDKYGNPVYSQPKNLSGAEEQKALGKGRGEAEITAKNALPAAQQAATDVAGQVDRLKNDPSLSSVLGPIDSRTPNLSAGSNRVQAYIDQLAGGAFLQARTLLKGGGQITDFEGRKAEQAYIRLNQAQSPEDFKSALDDFNDAVQAGLAKLSSQASGQSGASAAPGGATSSGVKWSAEP